MLCTEDISFFHKIVFIIPEMFVLILIKYSQPYTKILIHKEIHFLFKFSNILNFC